MQPAMEESGAAVEEAHRESCRSRPELGAAATGEGPTVGQEGRGGSAHGDPCEAMP